MVLVILRVYPDSDHPRIARKTSISVPIGSDLTGVSHYVLIFTLFDDYDSDGRRNYNDLYFYLAYLHADGFSIFGELAFVF